MNVKCFTIINFYKNITMQNKTILLDYYRHKLVKNYIFDFF